MQTMILDPRLPVNSLLSDTQAPDRLREMLSAFLQGDSKTEANLGSFTNTALGDDTQLLALQSRGKNLANAHEYPALSEVYQRCITIIASLWRAPEPERAIGVATAGSSEAILVAGTAMRKTWEKKKLGCRPNVIVGSHCHVAIDKFGFFCDVDVIKIPVSAGSDYTLDTRELTKYVSSGTIGVILVSGSTYTGHFDAVDEVAVILDAVHQERGFDIPIHVDAASGGFVAPFATLNPIKWDFSVSRVVSINASGHKYGMVLPSVGWLVWRSPQVVPAEMTHKSSYLRGDSTTVGLSYSQSGARIIEQYHTFATLGKQGFAEYARRAFRDAALFSTWIEETGWFTCINEYARNGSFLQNDDMKGVPMVVFSFSSKFARLYPHLSESWLSEQMYKEGYSIPDYPLPTIPPARHVLRVVVRYGTSSTVLEEVLRKLEKIIGSAQSEARLDSRSFTNEANEATCEPASTRA